MDVVGVSLQPGPCSRRSSPCRRRSGPLARRHPRSTAQPSCTRRARTVCSRCPWRNQHKRCGSGRKPAWSGRCSGCPGVHSTHAAGWPAITRGAADRLRGVEVAQSVVFSPQARQACVMSSQIGVSPLQLLAVHAGGAVSRGASVPASLAPPSPPLPPSPPIPPTPPFPPAPPAPPASDTHRLMVTSQMVPAPQKSLWSLSQDPARYCQQPVAASASKREQEKRAPGSQPPPDRQPERAGRDRDGLQLLIGAVDDDDSGDDGGDGGARGDRGGQRPCGVPPRTCLSSGESAQSRR